MKRSGATLQTNNMRANKKSRFQKLIRKANSLRQRLPWGTATELQKFDIVNALVRKNRYQRYLEICTATTGFEFGSIDRATLQVCHRLMYRCPNDFDDGHEVTFRSSSESTENLLDPDVKYDVVFVDPFHTFECSLRDLHLGLSALREGGTMVIHDCCPDDEECVTPWYKEGGWCGVTYCAYVDFLLSHSGLVYCTVDTDLGCGIVRRKREGEMWKPAHESIDGTIAAWRHRRSQNADMFDFFRANKRELLNLVSAQEFLAAENVPAPPRKPFTRPFRQTDQV
jgi:hypothetical protein